MLNPAHGVVKVPVRTLPNRLGTIQEPPKGDVQQSRKWTFGHLCAIFWKLGWPRLLQGSVALQKSDLMGFNATKSSGELKQLCQCVESILFKYVKSGRASYLASLAALKMYSSDMLLHLLLTRSCHVISYLRD